VCTHASLSPLQALVLTLPHCIILNGLRRPWKVKESHSALVLSSASLLAAKARHYYYPVFGYSKEQWHYSLSSFPADGKNEEQSRRGSADRPRFMPAPQTSASRMCVCSLLGVFSPERWIKPCMPVGIHKQRERLRAEVLL